MDLLNEKAMQAYLGTKKRYRQQITRYFVVIELNINMYWSNRTTYEYIITIREGEQAVLMYDQRNGRRARGFYLLSYLCNEIS